ncbi:PspC domain-containing protein [Sporomusa acidovorans]|uniref:Phage shock protein PspC N-terminal domain-containing protein n=1 Tax=Sporomusa acidovorans (strain ATCC 49682 / DSM 3132 / Mol) TaxID=1123286 RepID=A0ABZ3JC51_SPOA4|nr:PspC domain-containing protein [Sporomusa acidovorans]OZC13289.1 DNA-binding transcriptional activator PspC [Sporomusa acidovorans DSM 3132]SDD98123.1 phage shock protein C (PspC) family protein [Sporomusa acidovorans]
MIWLIRAGAYLFSGLAIWQFVQGANPADMAMFHRHLALDQAHGMIFGVCAGFSTYTGLDVTLIRLAWALAVLYRGAGLALYILAFLIMPVS